MATPQESTSATIAAAPRVTPVAAAALGGRIRLRGVADQFDGTLVAQSSTVITVRLEDGARLYVYAIGAVVIEGRNELDADLRNQLERATGLPVVVGTVEPFAIEENPTLATRVEIEWDRIVVRRHDQVVADAVAYLLAQSVALERYEVGADAMVEESAALAREFAVQGRPPWRRGLPVRRVAKLAEQRLELARWFFPLDRPEWTWEDEHVAELYDALFDHLELHERHEVLLHKLTSVQGTLQIVINLWESRRSRFLEWAIVVLIVVEIVLALLHA